MGRWKIVFEDHFDATEIDRSVWQYEHGFVRNHEPQFYTDRPENAYTENGDLVIVTRREEYDGAHYPSASLNTQRLKEFQYGLIEMRAKLPHGKGLWPAFWMMGSDFGNTPWPNCGEIDIMEAVSDINEENDRRIHMTLHWQSAVKDEHNEAHSLFFFEKEPYYTDYHIYALDWNAERIVWLIDGIERFRVEFTEDMQGAFNQPHFILINTALSDWNDNERPDDTTPFPQEYRIDYIRVSQWTED